MPLSKRLTFRLTPAEFERLEALAKAREVNLGPCVRQLVAEADVDQPARPRDAALRGAVLDLLRERAQDGNVAAISRLLKIERMRDPRSAAIAKPGFAMVASPGDSTVSTSPWWRPRNSTRSAAAVPRLP